MIKLPNDVQLIAVSKTRSTDEILALHESGQIDFAENRVQELIQKQDALSEHSAIRWHLIGTLQSNKVNQVVGRVHLIQSVHSLSLYRKIAKRASSLSISQPVLFQVNFSAEASKHGFDPTEVEAALEVAAESSAAPVWGLMTMSVAEMTAEEKLDYFKRFAAFYDSLEEKYNLNTLSIGMSGDYEEAIEAGSTMVRLGTAIFGPRS